MKHGKALFLVFGLILTLAGCAGNAVKQAMPSGDKILRASGFSRFDDGGQISVNHRWLSAQQQAKLGAYRGLADQLYHEPLGENKTVGSQVVSHEVYRVYLDTYLREARASDYRAVKDSLKTTLELKLTPRFYQCMGGDVGQANSCIQEDGKLTLTRLGSKTATTTSVNLACGVRDCSDQFHVKGFSKQRNAVDDALLDNGLYDVEWTVNSGVRILFNYLLINGFINVL